MVLFILGCIDQVYFTSIVYAWRHFGYRGVAPSKRMLLIIYRDEAVNVAMTVVLFIAGFSSDKNH